MERQWFGDISPEVFQAARMCLQAELRCRQLGAPAAALRVDPRPLPPDAPRLPFVWRTRSPRSSGAGASPS